MPLRAVVLSFDRLHIGYLGCYGNDWVETPNLDRLATQSVVFDRHFARHLAPALISQAWWGAPAGRHNAGADAGPPALLDSLSAAGVKTWLFAESDGGNAEMVAPPFDEIFNVHGTDSLEIDEDQPPFARLVRAAGERSPEIAAGAAPSLVWIKSRGVPAPWLPPKLFADLYLEEFGLTAEEEPEEDGDDLSVADSPSSSREKGVDAALELKYARALYAAYVTWLDRWVGKLWKTLETTPGWEETMWIVTAARGQSLGERGLLDEQALPLRAELIHVPLFVRLPDRQHDATRRAALTQTTDIAPTLLEWFGLGGTISSSSGGAPFVEDSGQSLLPVVRNERDTLRRYAFLDSPDERAVRSDSGLYVERCDAQPTAENGPGGLLFEKPCDRWDMADVASQHPEVCERLMALLRPSTSIGRA